MPRVSTLTGIDPADRQILSDWLDGISGVDTVIDLAPRPWKISGTGAIIGVFETGSDQASWLIVRHGSGWTLARCQDSFVSDVLDSLQAILELIDAQRRN